MRPSYQEMIDHEAYFGKANGYWMQVEAAKVPIERQQRKRQGLTTGWIAFMRGILSR